MRVWMHLWNDEQGTIISAELILIVTLTGLGLLAGLTTYRDQIVFELADLGTAVGQFNQSYSISSLVIGTGATASSFAGSTFLDTADFCDDTSSSGTDPTNAGTGCVAIIDATAE